ncbi:hypothetical protein P6709_06240 [Jeotgalibacillus sp. ET6]|uniref:hypothetical protein n=1 Tax=Jeotgalibacillus sp. ET6 TaxID=3037260 RepID=UPI0024181B45|nr:hypothetical protein [Jeotgalibacillus sp. ET6]MDG5471339.1 hypothetical protein [Jeotgalibacillus sp. ET6]
MKRLLISILIFLFILTGCATSQNLQSKTTNDGEEVVISEINDDELVVYKDLKDPTAEYPSYIVKVNEETKVIINGKQGERSNLKMNQTVNILLIDGILDEREDMTASKIEVLK